jgi:hypothetical protein
MLLGLLAGLAFSIGHHYFYQSLDGQAISNTTFDQQINIAIGTAFAFLVKASLAIAVGSAYVQYLWHTLRRERLKVDHIDSLASLLTSAIDFFNLGALRGHAPLAMLALLAWLIPLAAIVPPATLSVHASPDQHSTTSPKMISIPDWSSNNYAQQFQVETASPLVAGFNNIHYNGPQSYFTRLAWATALQGTIPTIDAPSLNASYTLNVSAPALSCQAVDASVLGGFTTAFGCDPRSNNTETSCQLSEDDVQNVFQYIAWTPSYNRPSYER